MIEAFSNGINTVRVKKTRQNECLKSGCDSMRTGLQTRPRAGFRLGLIEACPRQTLFGDLDFAAVHEGAARLFVTLARLSVARVSGMTEMIAAGRACVTFAGFHAHMSLGTMWKALEFDRGKCGLGHEKGQTEEHEKKRE